MLLIYLAAAVAANLFTYTFGPNASILSALMLIGLSFTVRDALHERWRGGVRVKMLALVAGASVLSWILNPAGGRIAVASAIAFAVSELLDATVYQALIRRGWMEKSNLSNTVGSAADSLIFPTIAFGGFMPLITIGQFLAKTLGGLAWSLVLRKRFVPVAVAALVVMLLPAQPAAAQIVSVSGAWIHNSAVSAPVSELFVAAPAVKGVRPYGIASLDLSTGDVTYLTRVGYSRQIGRARFGVGAGAVYLKFLDYDPKPSFSVSAHGPGLAGLTPYAVVAYEKTPTWTTTTFIGVSRTLWFRR